MERVSFLIERTGAHISSLLNPETLVLRRAAGVRSRRGATGIITGRALSDDPLVATGGGVTELDLDLLFDVDIAREAAAVVSDSPLRPPPADVAMDQMDVRDLTRPIWNLAENAADGDAFGVPPTVRFIWGRAWNIPGIVVAMAERLERFVASGVPQRSWLRLRLRRVAEADAAASRAAAAPLPRAAPTAAAPSPAAVDDVPRVAVPVGPDGMPSLRLDQIASDRYGDPSLWRWVASVNNIENPLALREGAVLQLAAHRAES
ncbi:hypothetical protein [Bradyrhizobium sp. SZCCHNS3051]|uniref:hypothetical protein n=1 Tax=Bradyrhizobium sp. SZCCHNS3051 TaxID=3057320 RepID=UPI002916DC5A|nr:hypothetical protein [Bradyrhizobium sp. SZCCHNS3051]